MVRSLALTLLVLAAASATGCGASADRREARAAARDLYAAAARHDGQAACAQMSSSLRTALVEDQQQRCAKAVLALDLHGQTPASAKVYATSAVVRFEHGDTVFLDQTSEGWRVDALGCRPNGKGPYDCEEQA
jgi:hypothetical protein